MPPSPSAVAAASPPARAARLRIVALSADRFALDRLGALLADAALTCVAPSVAGWAEAVRRAAPDLLMIDVAAGDGFSAHAGLALSDVPVVFLANTPDRAACAFDAGAIDFLVKPLAADRVARAIARARHRIAARRAGARVIAVEREVRMRARPPEPRDEALWVRRCSEWRRIPPEAIEWLCVQEDYVCVRAFGDEHLLRGSLDQLLGRLDARRFVRVHRRAAVAPAWVGRLLNDGGDRARLEMRDGTILPVGRIHGRDLAHRLNRS